MIPKIKFLLFILFFGPILFGNSNCNGQAQKSQLRVMSYNVWNGFNWGKDTLRKTNCIRWIKSKHPDVVALQELCGYNEEKLKADAKQWGHNYVKILKTKGYPVGLTSRKPITLKERVISEMWHGMLHCKTYGIDFFIVHLSPKDCDFRLREAQLIAQKVLHNNSENFIVLGDFNAHSPFDAEQLEPNLYLKKKYAKVKTNAFRNLRNGTYDYAVLSTFMAIPTIDISTKFTTLSERFSYPSNVLIGRFRKSKEDVIQTRERIDYILTSSELSKSCVNFKIYNKGITETLSDHFPVMASFEIVSY